MLNEKMYVRCPIDHDMINPRDYLMGQITKIDTFADLVTIAFNDPFNYRFYYEEFPQTATLPIQFVQRCVFFDGAIVEYNKVKYKVITCIKDSKNYNEYYLENIYDKSIIKADEKCIIAPFTIGKVDPSIQLKRYEFQNPCWFFGRTIVSKTMNILDNSIYGFKELAGCKIFLMPHQLKTIIRCLQDEKCRYMLADEVGMGKTIEAAAVLKVYFSRHSDLKALIIAPKSLLEQWKTELFLKFDLYEGKNDNNNYIRYITFEDCNDEVYEKFDFLIIDEVHRVLTDEKKYNFFHKLSRNAENVLLLSATPVQQKREDYLDLLRLIMPEKYDGFIQEEFNILVEKQAKITKNASMILSDIEELDEIIKSSDNLNCNFHLNEDCEDLFDDIQNEFDKLYFIVKDDLFKNIYQKAKFNDDDLGIYQFKIAISYICDNYQIEKNIIRNRRETMEDIPKRELRTIPYTLNPDKNFYEYRIYENLVSWITNYSLSENEFDRIFKPLFESFFSSSWAFENMLNDMMKKGVNVSSEIIENVKRWKWYEQDIIDNICEVLNNPEEYSSRIVNIVYYLDEYIDGSKVVIFTNYDKTFEMYEKLLGELYTRDKYSCFRKGMSSDDLEVNVCKFQNDKNCTIMLCDESGGEGRNFQCADFILHIDIPWNANIIEQRIGRLDRIGRSNKKPVVSVVPYAEETLEEELFKFWNNGLDIFQHSLSGLEIIMNDINKSIVKAIITDFKYGLSNEIQNVIKRSVILKKEIREEQHFDTAAYIYRPLNQQLISLVKYYNQNENKMFEDAMLKWARLSGFRDVEEKEDVIIFSENSFSSRSAKNSLLIPPDWNEYFAKRQNRFINRIKELRQDKNNEDRLIYNRTIEGTFNRRKAIENDYIHFFAPGDEIFDCIVNNALKSCRGQASAFAMKSHINWKGFIYTWSLCPNEKILIDNGISLSYLNNFRNYLSINQVQIPVGFSKYEEIQDTTVISEFNRIVQNDFELDKDDIDHLGRRGLKNGLLGIPLKYRSSNMDYFRSIYPQERWEELVAQSRNISKKKALKVLKECSHITDAKDEIERILTSIIATAKYYEVEPINYERERDIYNIILKSIANPVVKLESACFVWMVSK